MSLACTCCNTRIETTLPVPRFLALPLDLQEFAMIFLRCRGNIREVEKELGISYPTVCKRLDLLNEMLSETGRSKGRQRVLERLSRGEISVSEATRLLKTRSAHGQ